MQPLFKKKLLSVCSFRFYMIVYDDTLHYFITLELSAFSVKTYKTLSY